MCILGDRNISMDKTDIIMFYENLQRYTRLVPWDFFKWITSEIRDNNWVTSKYSLLYYSDNTVNELHDIQVMYNLLHQHR